MLAGIALASLVGCSGPSVAPDRPKEVRNQPIHPFETHEECLAMARGDEVEWHFAADLPVDFAVAFRDGNALVMPLVREQVRADEGRFVALADREHCLAWQAGSRGAKLDYGIAVARSRK